MKSILLKSIILLGTIFNMCFAQIPNTLSYQGVLTDAKGEILNGEYTLLFKIYEASEAENSIWQESHNTMITDGMFNVMLGSGNTLDLPFDKPYWLGITINDSPEMKPRIMLNASPYSFNAKTVSDSSVTKAKVASGELVKSLNNLTDNITIAGGKNIKVVQSGDSLIISVFDNAEEDFFTDDTHKKHRNWYVKSLNGRTGHVKIKMTGGAEILEDEKNTLVIKAGQGNISEIQSSDESISIENSTGPLTTLSVNKAGINTDHMADSSVTSQKLASGAVTGSAIADSSISSSQILNNSITSEKIVDQAVTGAKISDGAITKKKISSDVVFTPGGNAAGDLSGEYPNPQIKEGAVTTSKIADGAITSQKIDPSVTLPISGKASGDLEGTYPGPQIRASAVNSDKILDGSVSNADLAGNSVSSDKLQDGSVTAAKIDPSLVFPVVGVAGGDLEGNYPNPAIKNGAVTEQKIAVDQVVKSINNFRDNVSIEAGENVSITSANNTVSISARGDNDWIQTGNNLYAPVSGNIGIGTATPEQKLDVKGTVSALGLQITTGASEGYVLTSDAGGLASWRPFSGSIDGSGSVGYLPLFTGVNTLASSAIFEHGTRIGLGTTNLTSKFNVFSTNELIAARFTSDRLNSSTHIVHAEYTGPSGTNNVIASYGLSRPGDGYGYGGYFEGGFVGAIGQVIPTGNRTYAGLRGYVAGGSGTNYGIISYARGSNRNFGLFGTAAGLGSSLNIGVYGEAGGGSENYAGYFNGVLYAQNITASVKNFKIDHPLDPENKYLNHFSIESPDMMNVYNGNVVLNGDGEASITLPGYFESLNKDFRYQLTCIGGFAPVYIAEKISDNKFKIAGGSPGLEVSWQVTGVRKDPQALQVNIPVEQYKPDAARGKYLSPEAYGQPASQGEASEISRKEPGN